MVSTFIQHELKLFWRSKNTGKNLAIRIIMGIMILYLMACFLLLGFILDKIIFCSICCRVSNCRNCLL